MNATLFLYGSLVVGFMLWGEVVEQKLFDAQFYHYGLRKRVNATPMIVLRFMVGKEFYLVGVFVLAFVMALAVGGFLAYHLWLTSKNMTTNESAKRSEERREGKECVSTCRSRGSAYHYNTN